MGLFLVEDFAHVALWREGDVFSSDSEARIISAGRCSVQVELISVPGLLSPAPFHRENGLVGIWMALRHTI